ncbi:MAG: glycosyltransferase family 39 protein [Chloroflexi bacterium]|nr:glycosyltransferase family 39 protein [Chloroflexota bacterium]
MDRIVLLLLAAVIIVAAFARLFHISSNPPSISWDEASIGYNAYSILKTGRDEHGKFLPVDAFAAFGDYKPPVAVYLTVPFVAALGLTEAAVRLPSATAGILTVLALYFLITELFRGNRNAKWIGITGSAVLSVTPWHIMLSRAGFEANIAVLFIVLGVWWTLAARHNPRFLFVCWLPFVAGVYTFNSARYAGPVIALGCAVVIAKTLWKFRRQAIAGIVIGCVALLPIVPHLRSKQSRLRFNEVSIFTNLDVVLTANARQKADGNTWWADILDNRRLGYLHSYLVHFFDNVQPRFLFMNGDGNPKFSVQDTGELLLVSAPFVAYGFLRLFTDTPGTAWLLVFWLAAAIAPAAVARETPHALRTENGLPVFMIATAYGLFTAFAAVRKRLVRNLLFALCIVLFAGNFIYFWHTLMVHYPTQYSGTWQYGYKQAIAYADSVAGTYDTIVLTESIGRPYIYVLFYDRVDPRVFWKENTSSFDAAGFYNVYGFGTYRFVNEKTGTYRGRTLYMLDPGRVPQQAHILKTIRTLNGEPAIVIFDL